MEDGRQVWYLELLWHHQHPAEPVAIYSEVGEDSYETRKVARFRNGRLLSADDTHESDEVGIAEAPIDPPEVWNREIEFEARLLTPEAFEELWDLAELAPESTRPDL